MGRGRGKGGGNRQEVELVRAPPYQWPTYEWSIESPQSTKLEVKNNIISDAN